jgi:ribonuclease BN (tRNA processing enzyme)
MTTGISPQQALLIAVCTLLLIATSQADVSGQAVDSQKDLTGTRLVLLGTGTPNADPDRFGPAVAVVVNDTPYLVDFGAGVVRRAAAARRKGIEALRASNLRHAFLTHLHTDHSVGYADLVFTPWVLERDVPLKVFGPKGLQDMTNHIQAAYQQDIDIRLNGLEPANTEGYKVDVREVEPGLIYQDENVKVTAFAVKHGSWKQSFGYRFESADKTIVVSGDAAPSESIVEMCNGCDILVHEVYSTAGYVTRPPVWQTYHASFHTSTKELADLASRAKPGLLVLYHQLYWGVSDQDLLAEIRQEYDGKVVSGADLDIF